MNEWWMNEWMNEWMRACVRACMNEWMNEWMNERMNETTAVYVGWDCSCQEDKQIQLALPDPRLFSGGPGNSCSRVSASAQEFLIQIGRRLSEVTTDSRETAFLFQRLSVAVQRFNAACLADTFPISESAPWPFQTRFISFLIFTALVNWVPRSLEINRPNPNNRNNACACYRNWMEYIRWFVGHTCFSYWSLNILFKNPRSFVERHAVRQFCIAKFSRFSLTVIQC